MQMVHEDNELYSVTDMAELLFGNTSPTSCYASHRLLSQERIFFKQAGRSPPRFQARSEKDVQSLRAKRLAEEKVLTRCSSSCSFQCFGETARHVHTLADCMTSAMTWFGAWDAILATCCDAVQLLSHCCCFFLHSAACTTTLLPDTLPLELYQA